MVKTGKNLLTLLLILSAFAKNIEAKVDAKPALAEWTMLTYIAADNTLAEYAAINIKDMSAGLVSTAGVNVLVQWDKPADKKTWRYKITPGGTINAGTLSSDMGYNPANELVASMQWVKNNYPAKRYALILWDHGSGVLDYEPGTTTRKLIKRTLGTTWMQIPGRAPQPIAGERGILYDDTQYTCLTNQGLSSSLASIKKIIGQNIDLVAMDACLMAMAEVAYQMKDCVNLFVASEQTIPGTGYPYSKFIKPLSLNPAGTTTLDLAKNMISGYQQYYTTQEPTPDFTLSIIDVMAISLIKENIDQFIGAVNACNAIDAKTTKAFVVAARKASASFDTPEYVDLYSFYAALLGKIKKASPKSSLILHKTNRATSAPSQAYQKALNNLTAVIQDGITKIETVVLKSVSGPTYAGVKGLSIYYPRSGGVDSTYLQTLFAKNTAWVKFIQQYR